MTSIGKISIVASRQSIGVDLADLLVDGKVLVYPEVESKGYFTVRFSGNKLQLTAGPFVGLIPINPNLTLDVRPKVPTKNLGRIIALSQESIRPIEAIERLYATEDSPMGSILELLTLGLLQAVRPIRLYGFHKEYRVISRNSSHPRGRIDMLGSIRNKSRGITHRLVDRRFEHSMDTDLNRIVKYALWFAAQRLMRSPRTNRALMAEINDTLLDMDSVRLECDSGLCQRVDKSIRLGWIPANRGYYAKALKIALALIAGKGVSLMHGGRDLELASYVVNFENVFESYLLAVLRQNPNSFGSGYVVKDGNAEAKQALFDDRPEPLAQPDFVISSLVGNCLVGDAKYKDKYDRSDLNQLITYAVSFRANTALVIHAKAVNGPGGLSLLGMVNSVAVYAYVFDLSGDDLLVEERAFCRAVASIL